MVQAKFKALKGYILTDEEMIRKLRQILRKHGYLNRQLIDASPDLQLSKAYIRRFGSIHAAYRLAGYEPVSRFREHAERLSMEPDEIVARLRALLAEEGYLSSSLIRRSPRLPSLATVRRRLGGLINAYRLAGFNLTRSEMLVASHERRRRAGE